MQRSSKHVTCSMGATCCNTCGNAVCPLDTIVRTFLQLGACALQGPVAACFASSCDEFTAGACTVAHCAGNRAAAAVKLATSRSLWNASAHCTESTHGSAHLEQLCSAQDKHSAKRACSAQASMSHAARAAHAAPTAMLCARPTPLFPPACSWVHVPCTVQLPVASHVAVIGPSPIVQVPLHTVPATGLLPQSKLPPAGTSGLPVHTGKKRTGMQATKVSWLFVLRTPRPGMSCL
jgi:hypothetical protein